MSDLRHFENTLAKPCGRAEIEQLIRSGQISVSVIGKMLNVRGDRQVDILLGYVCRALGINQEEQDSAALLKDINDLYREYNYRDRIKNLVMSGNLKASVVIGLRKVVGGEEHAINLVLQSLDMSEDTRQKDRAVVRKAFHALCRKGDVFSIEQESVSNDNEFLGRIRSNH